MKTRIARSGSYKGRRFWGCSHFPECSVIVNIDFSNESLLGESINDLQHSQVTNKPDFKRPAVEVGSIVRIQFLENGNIGEYTIFKLERDEIYRTGLPYIKDQKPEIVVLNPGNPMHDGRLSDESPLGKALLGKYEGEVAKCLLMAGSYEVKILNILG